MMRGVPKQSNLEDRGVRLTSQLNLGVVRLPSHLLGGNITSRLSVFGWNLALRLLFFLAEIRREDRLVNSENNDHRYPAGDDGGYDISDAVRNM